MGRAPHRDGRALYRPTLSCTPRPVGRGYVHLRETGRGLWPAPPPGEGALIRAHEFHYSSVENLAPDVRFAYDVERGHGIDGRHDGIVHRNLLASYAHLRDVDGNHWARRFVEFIRRCKYAPSPVTQPSPDRSPNNATCHRREAGVGR